MKRSFIIIVSLWLFTSYLIAQTVDPRLLERIHEIREGYTFTNDAWFISVEGDTILFSSLQREWVLLDYWSAGCKPCIEAFPILKSLNDEDSINLSVVAINVDKTFDRFEKYHRKYDLGYPNFYSGFTLSNPLLLANLQLVMLENGGSKLVTLTPQYILLNHEGKIVHKNLPKPGSSKFYQVLNSIVK